NPFQFHLEVAFTAPKGIYISLDFLAGFGGQVQLHIGKIDFIRHCGPLGKNKRSNKSEAEKETKFIHTYSFRATINPSLIGKRTFSTRLSLCTWVLKSRIAWVALSVFSSGDITFPCHNTLSAIINPPFRVFCITIS